MEDFIQYAPLALVVVGFLVQLKVFVTPEQLEKKHREIMETVEAKFAPNHSVSTLKEQLIDMKSKLDKIYDYIINS